MMRSLLYVPANSERFIAKAHERDADAIILDLEDAVPAANKLEARRALTDSIARVRQGGATVAVRINPGNLEDATAAAQAGADLLVIPKVQAAADIDAIATVLEPVERTRAPLRFIALLEDPGAVLDSRAIARAPRLIGLATGSEDLATALGGEPTPDVLRFPKLLVHYAAKAQGLQSFGLLRSVADYADSAAIAAAAKEARQHGFDGATCVHPAVVPLLNEAFAPSAADRQWAAEVLAMAEHAGGAFAFAGRMVDAPVLARARRILAERQPD